MDRDGLIINEIQEYEEKRINDAQNKEIDLSEYSKCMYFFKVNQYMYCNVCITLVNKRRL